MRVWSYSNTPLRSTRQIYFTPGLSVVAFHTLKAASQAKQQHRHPRSDWQLHSQESRQHCSMPWKKHRGFQAQTVNRSHLYLKLRYVSSVSTHCTEICTHVLHGEQITQCVWQEQHPHCQKLSTWNHTPAVEIDRVLACRSEPHLPLLSLSWSLWGFSCALGNTSVHSRAVFMAGSAAFSPLCSYSLPRHLTDYTTVASNLLCYH